MRHLPARADSNSQSWPLPELPHWQSCRPAAAIVRQQNIVMTLHKMQCDTMSKSKQSWNALAKGTKMCFYYSVCWTKCDKHNLQHIHIYNPHAHTLLAVLNRKLSQQKQMSLSQIVDNFHWYSSVRHSGFRLFAFKYYRKYTASIIHNNSQY